MIFKFYDLFSSVLILNRNSILQNSVGIVFKSWSRSSYKKFYDLWKWKLAWLHIWNFVFRAHPL